MVGPKLVYKINIVNNDCKWCEKMIFDIDDIVKNNKICKMIRYWDKMI